MIKKERLGRQRTNFVYLTLIFLFWAIFGYCQEGFKVIEVEPAKIRLIIPPGSSQSGSINIYNSSSEPKEVKVYLEDWFYLPACDGTKEFRPQGSTALSAGNWISFYPAEFKIPAFGKQIVNYTVKVPQDAKGGHYAVLFFETYMGQSDIAKEGVSVNLAVRVASLFYIEAKGTINREIKLENLRLDYLKDKYNISLNLTNTGNADIATDSSFFIIDAKGIVYARGKFNDTYTFPGDTAILNASFKERLPSGEYDLVLTFDLAKALKEVGLGEALVVTKEAKLQIGQNGEVIRVGELK